MVFKSKGSCACREQFCSCLTTRPSSSWFHVCLKTERSTSCSFDPANTNRGISTRPEWPTQSQSGITLIRVTLLALIRFCSASLHTAASWKHGRVTAKNNKISLHCRPPVPLALEAVPAVMPPELPTARFGSAPAWNPLQDVPLPHRWAFWDLVSVRTQAGPNKPRFKSTSSSSGGSNFLRRGGSPNGHMGGGREKMEM